MLDWQHSTRIQNLLDRLRTGDSAAKQELMERTDERIHILARKMFRGFSKLQAAEQTEDIAQLGRVRLIKALDTNVPATVREFFGMAARQINWVLLDAARKLAKNPVMNFSSSVEARAIDDEDSWSTVDWEAFHNSVNRLSDDLKEVIDLLFYQGLSQEEAAQVLEVSSKTVRRRWMAARLRLSDCLASFLPASVEGT